MGDKLKCKRCGVCCENVWINRSPEKLKKEYLVWRYQKKKDKDIVQDIWILYPMLDFKFKRLVTGKKKKNNYFIYSYRCKNLKYDCNNKAVCTIHDIKPGMCSGYGTEYNADYSGCGMNKDISILNRKI